MFEPAVELGKSRCKKDSYKVSPFSLLSVWIFFCLEPSFLREVSKSAREDPRGP